MRPRSTPGAAAFGSRGFRSGAMYRRQDWLSALDISYDMSVPNVAHLEPQAGGCCTVMPFFMGHVLELPLTAAQDYTVFHVLDDYSTRLWQEQIDRVLARDTGSSASSRTPTTWSTRARERSTPNCCASSWGSAPSARSGPRYPRRLTSGGGTAAGCGWCPTETRGESRGPAANARASRTPGSRTGAWSTSSVHRSARDDFRPRPSGRHPVGRPARTTPARVGVPLAGMARGAEAHVRVRAAGPDHDRAGAAGERPRVLPGQHLGLAAPGLTPLLGSLRRR